MKSILIVVGGDRRDGNTEQLVEAFAKGATEIEDQVERISLSKHGIKGCIGCNSCPFEKLQMLLQPPCTVAFIVGIYHNFVKLLQKIYNHCFLFFIRGNTFLAGNRQSFSLAITSVGAV